MIVDSGHGLHPYWPISDGHITGGDIGAALALVRRWGRLVAVAADQLHAGVDNVYDLARMMRVPGTLNNKTRGNGAAPIPVVAHDDTGGPLSVAKVDERLTRVGILEEPGDRDAEPEQVSDPGEWRYARQTCPYVAKILTNLPTDGPPANPKPGKGRGRHQWAASQAVKLTCALQLGCITETDWGTAHALLKQRLEELRAATNETVPKFEIGGLFKLGKQRAAAKTDEQCRAELGGHTHPGAPDAPQSDVAGDTPRRRPRITWANTIPAEPVEWAWKGNLEDSQRFQATESWNLWNLSGQDSGRIAAGTLALGSGREGEGKSSFVRVLASKVSNGTLLGAWYGTPRTVLYVTVEESWKHTVVPGLIGAEADLSRIGQFDVITDTDNTVSLSLPFDNDLLEQSIREHQVALVVLDPLLSMISERIDSHRERDVRQALDPLAAIAERTGAVIFGIAHFNKGSGSDISARITGSGAFKNVPRAVFGFARDPDSDGEYVLTQSKNSLGRYDLPSLRYRIESTEISTPKGMTTTGRFVPLGESTKSVGDILDARGHGDEDRGDDGLTPAQRFIIGYIQNHGDENGEVPSSQVITAGAPVGYTRDDLIKARNKAKSKIATRRVGLGGDGAWMWSLPKDSSTNTTRTPSDHKDSKDSRKNTFRDDGESMRSEPCGAWCECGNQMVSPLSVARGYCERCHLTSKQEHR